MAFSWGFKPLAIASAVAFSTLGLLSKRCQRARFYFHSTLFFSSLGAASIWGLIITVLAAATGEVSQATF
jgi:lysophosphatidate acyltransferase